MNVCITHYWIFFKHVYLLVMHININYLRILLTIREFMFMHIVDYHASCQSEFGRSCENQGMVYFKKLMPQKKKFLSTFKYHYCINMNCKRDL